MRYRGRSSPLACGFQDVWSRCGRPVDRCGRRGGPLLGGRTRQRSSRLQERRSNVATEGGGAVGILGIRKGFGELERVGVASSKPRGRGRHGHHHRTARSAPLVSSDGGKGKWTLHMHPTQGIDGHPLPVVASRKLSLRLSSAYTRVCFSAHAAVNLMTKPRKTHTDPIARQSIQNLPTLLTVGRLPDTGCARVQLSVGPQQNRARS